MDKLKKLIVLLVLINTQFITAQAISLDETIFLHANSSTFVTGETLLYKVYCLKASDKTPSKISKIAYVELVDSNDKSVFKTKIQLENSNGQGDYFIPTTLKTGNYKLLGYTNWILNGPISNIFQIDITIINPYITNSTNNNTIKTGNTTIVSLNKETVENIETFKNENLEFKLEKKIFSYRELVNLRINTSNKIFNDGNYSLSVRKIDGLPSDKLIKAIDFLPKGEATTLDIAKNKNIILPELRGEIITGKVTAKNNTDKVGDLAVALSLPGKSYAFYISKTDSDGNFTFNIDRANYNRNIIIQIIDTKADNFIISLGTLPEIDYSKLTFKPSQNLSYIYKESLIDRSISSQIENAYFNKKTDLFVKPVSIEPFYYPLAKEYILDNYKRFNTIKETITEVSTEIFSRQTNNNFYLHVTDSNIFPQLPEPALVLIDGMLLQNQNDLLNYNMKNIYKIDLIPGRYYIGPKSFNGLISLSTFEKDFESNQKGSPILKTTFLRPQLKKIYYKINYTNPTEYERIPDFRNQLFWNTDVKLNNESNNTFYTSDLSGTFEIILEGFAKSGLPVSLRQIIEVKDSTIN